MNPTQKQPETLKRKLNNMQNLTPKELDVVQQKREALEDYFATTNAKWDDYKARCEEIDRQENIKLNKDLA